MSKALCVCVSHLTAEPVWVACLHTADDQLTTGRQQHAALMPTP